MGASVLLLVTTVLVSSFVIYKSMYSSHAPKIVGAAGRQFGPVVRRFPSRFFLPPGR